MPSELLDIAEAATMLHLPSTVRNWILKRRIPFVKMGSRVFLRHSDLTEFIDQHLVKSRAQESQSQALRKVSEIECLPLV